MVPDENPTEQVGERVGSKALPVLEYQSPGTVGYQWASIYTARSAEEAYLAVSHLQQFGLHARVDGEYSGGVWVRIPAIVQVRERDVGQATAILAATDRHRADRAAATAVNCTQCGGEARPLMHPLRKLAWAMWLVLWLGMPFAGFLDLPMSGWVTLLLPAGLVLMLWKVTPRWKCPACDIRWSQSEPEEAIDDDDQDIDTNEMHEDKGTHDKEI